MYCLPPELMAKAIVLAMKENRPDLVETNYRTTGYDTGAKTGRAVQVGFKPIKLEMSNGASHRIYANFYSSSDRKKVIEALMNTANSLGSGTYSFKEWYGKMRDYYWLWDMLFLASAVGVDLEATIGKFVSLKSLRGTVLGKSLNL